MDDAEIIDKFLEHLYDQGNKGSCLDDVVSVDKSQRDRVEITLTGERLVEELKSYVAGKRRFKISEIGIGIIIKHGSYTKYLDNIDQNESLKKKIDNLTIENLTLQNKRLKRDIWILVLGWFVGFLTSHIKDIFQFLKSLLP